MSSGAFPWSKFFWSDWESDEALRQCSLAAQGLWMRLLCICAKGEPRGYLAIAGNPLDVNGVAKAAGISATEAETLLEELDRWGVFSRDRKGRIYSRRMVRDVKRSQEGRKHIKKRWSQVAENKEENPPPNREASRVPTTQKPEARSQKLEEEESKPSPDDEDFRAWYEAYPRHVGKGQARKAYRAALAKADAGTLLAAATAFAAECAGKEPRFIPHPQTWLNGERWLDERAPPGGDGIDASEIWPDEIYGNLQ